MKIFKTFTLIFLCNICAAQQQKSVGLERWQRLWGSNWDTPLSYKDFQIEFQYSSLKGIGYEEGIGRRDPTGIIKVGGLYYIWYTRIESDNRPVGFEKANDTLRAVTWDLATIWYATSKDGINWEEQGEAIPLGSKGEFDDRSVFTPDVLVVNGRYYLFYQAVSAPYTQITRNVIAMSWADSPNGPWNRHPEPILKTGEPGKWVDRSQVPNPVDFGWPISEKSEWDGHKVHDPTLIVRDGKYMLYYKGQPYGEGMSSPPDKRRADKYYGLPIAQGVAIADKPEGPYLKSPLNPVIGAGHESIFWPHGTGVASLIIQGPEAGTIQYAPDGLNFYIMAHVDNWPVAAGVYREGNFADIKEKPSKGITWGIFHEVRHEKTRFPYLIRFDAVKRDR